VYKVTQAHLRIVHNSGGRARVPDERMDEFARCIDRRVQAERAAHTKPTDVLAADDATDGQAPGRYFRLVHNANVGEYRCIALF
jgi:hypothetical protein